MIFPTARLVAIAAAVGIPLCTAAGLLPRLALACVLLLLICVALAVADAVRGARAMRGVKISTEPALTWVKGRRSTIRLDIESMSTQAVGLKINLELPDAIEAVQPAAASENAGAPVAIECVPQERGRFRIFMCQIAALSCWRLWNLRAECPVNIDIRVLPDLEREQGAKLLFLRKPGGLRTQRVLGKGREFERLREYAPGDSFDEINWKATARRGRPVVKVFQVERTQDVYVILDSSRLSAKNNSLERFVNAALMVALAAEAQGDKFGLVAFSERVHHFVAASRGKGHFSRCRDAIYDLQARKVSPDFAELVTFLELRVRKRSLLLFLTDLGDPMLAELFLQHARLLARRHVVLVSRMDDRDARPLFSAAAPETVTDIYAKLAGHLEWTVYKNLERNLGRLGIGLRTLRPEFAGSDLIAQYADIKRRQVL